MKPKLYDHRLDGAIYLATHMLPAMLAGGKPIVVRRTFKKKPRKKRKAKK